MTVEDALPWLRQHRTELLDSIRAEKYKPQPVRRKEIPKPDGPAAYFATLPIRAMTEAVRAAGLPASISNTAGTFVCNRLMYGLLHHLNRRHPAVRGGFLHVPLTTAQALARKLARPDEPLPPSLPPAEITRGLAAAISALEPTEAGAE
ncbi:MAG: hypothetical protein II458_04100 [Oscillospiraceae bacterium]|nr:hypothetical protein [Oscillospiraceae bacterium]